MKTYIANINSKGWGWGAIYVLQAIDEDDANHRILVEYSGFKGKLHIDLEEINLVTPVQILLQLRITT